MLGRVLWWTSVFIELHVEMSRVFVRSKLLTVCGLEGNRKGALG